MQSGLLELAVRTEATKVVQEALLQRDGGCLWSLVLDPIVIQRLFGCVAVTWIHLKEHADEVLCILGDVLPVSGVEGEVAQSHLGQHLGVRLPEEGRVAAEHDIHDDAAAPEVTELVVLPCKDLRRDVVGRARLCREHLARLVLAGQPEINDLEDVLLYSFLGHEEEILGLEVAVADLVLVHVVNRADDLLHQVGCLGLCEVASLDDSVEELATAAELHHQVDAAVVLEGLVELYDVRVIHELHDGDLLLEPLDVLHLSLGDGLDRADDVRGLVLRLAHGAVGALPEFLLLHVVAVRDLPGVVHDEHGMADAVLLDLLRQLVGGPALLAAGPGLVAAALRTGRGRVAAAGAPHGDCAPPSSARARGELATGRNG
mmetsp:Transcript_98965/g.308400  ORF Transcript_98965/g.308400 Transcript_98965/m.308400 type:complete len:374 (-) Transcript_98965:42-1163(-)